MATSVDASAVVRRAFHLTSPVWLIWYWIPPDAGIGVRKEAVLVILLSLALLVEAGRLLSGRRLLGLRANESSRMSAYAWGSLGLAVGLLFFPGEVVILTFWGMAWIDPLCAYTRSSRGYPWVPFAAYALLAAVLSLTVVPTATYQTRMLGVLEIALVATLGAAMALVAERPNLAYVDDDFLMNVVPMVVLSALLFAI